MGQNDGSDKMIMKVGDIENVANLGALALGRFGDRPAEESGGTFLK